MVNHAYTITQTLLYTFPNPIFMIQALIKSYTFLIKERKHISQTHITKLYLYLNIGKETHVLINITNNKIFS